MGVALFERKGIGRYFRLLACIFSIQLFCLLFALSAFPAESNLTQRTPEKGRAKSHDARIRLRDSARRLEKAREKGESEERQVNDVMEDVAAFEDEDAQIKRSFKAVEEKLRDAGTGKAWKRHREAIQRYQRRSAEIKDKISAVREARKNKAHPAEIENRVRNLIQEIDRDGTGHDYELKDSSRLPWRVVQPGDIMLLGDASSMPASVIIPPSAPPSADDLSSTLDVQLTPEITALAESLGKDPLTIFRYVYNNYKFTPYYGSMKGSLDTYWEKEGNDHDLASLLIALLRASGVPARYGRTKIIVPAEKLSKWVGIDDPMAAMQYLSMAQIPVGYYLIGGRIANVQLEHVYVEAFVPYGNYRGTGEDDTGKMWIPMDPSFKEVEVTQVGEDIASKAGLTWKTFSNDYLSDLQNLTPLDYYRKKIDDYVAQAYPGQTVDSLKRVEKIKEMQFDFLPGTLPYDTSQVPEVLISIPQELRHTVRFSIPNVLDYSISLPGVSGRRITLSFEGADADDQALIAQFGNIFKTPPYLIQVKPVLRINGAKVAEGTAMEAAAAATFSVVYTQPGGKTDTFEHHIITGSYNAVGLTTGQVRPEFLTIAEVEASEEPYMSKMLHSLVMKYHNQQNVAKQVLGETMKIKSKTFFSEALVSSREDMRFAMGMVPVSFDLAGFMIDAKETSSGVMPVNGYDKNKVIDFAMIYGHEASYQENRTFEDSMFWVSGLSAVKGIQILKAMGIGITEVTPPMTYANSNLPDTVVTDINNALNMGWSVLVPEDTGGLPAVPYIKYDPNTGSAGYMIAARAGGFNGYLDVDADLLDFISFSIGSWTPPTQLLGMEFEVLFPESGLTVVLGDSFYLGLKMITRWKDATHEWTEETAHPTWGMNVQTGPGWFTAKGLPLPWWKAGIHKICYNAKAILNFNAWGATIDSDASGKYIGINSDNGTETTVNSVLIKYSIKEDPAVTIEAIAMKVYNGTSVVRTVPDLAVGEGKMTGWDGRDDGRNIVAPGEYIVVIETTGDGKPVKSDGHKVTVFKVEITTPITTAMDISNVPTMPSVTFNAKILPSSVKLSDVMFKWYLDISFRRDRQPTDDLHKVPSTGTTEVTGSSSWTPNWGNLIAGGNVYVHLAAAVRGIEAKHNQNGYQIRGANPSQGQVFQMARSSEERAICWQESTHRQFNTDGPYAGFGPALPSYGRDGGYGLMMITLPVPATSLQVWNWQFNMQSGIAFLNGLRSEAQNYLNIMFSRAARTADPGDDWNWNPAEPAYSYRVWDDAFSRYGPRRPGDPVTIYSPNGNGGNRNCNLNPSGCNYANTIRSHINSRPWEAYQ